MKERDPNGVDQHKPGAKLDSGKIQVGLIIHGMPRAMQAVSEVATYGAIKYTPGGWAYVQEGHRRYTDAMLRHLLSEAISPFDEESGLLHAAQVAWNALARLEIMLRDNENAR